MSSIAHEGARRRVGWGLGDQALSSVTNIVIALIAARSLDADGFGEFSVAFATYILAVGVTRSLVGDVVLVRHSKERTRDVADHAAGASVVLGVCAGATLLVVAALTRGQLGMALLALAVTMPGLLVQDTLRFTFVAEGRPAGAFSLDAVWAIAQIGSVGALVLLDSTPSAPAVVLAWGVSGSFAALVGLLIGSVRPRPRATRAWLLDGRQFGPRFLVEFFATQGAWQLTLYMVGGVVGLAALGSLRATQVLYGPLHVVNVGARLAAIPEGTRRRGVPGHSTVRMAALMALVLGSCALLWLLVLQFMPSTFGEALLGDSWAGASEFIVPFGLFMVTQGVVSAAAIGLRVLEASAASMRAAVIGAAITYGGAMVVSFSDNLDAVVWWLAGAGAVATLLWWHTFLRVEHSRVGQEVADDPGR